MTITVTVVDNEAGTTETREMPPHDYFIVTTGECHIAHINTYPKAGTHVLTIKGRRDTGKSHG